MRLRKLLLGSAAAMFVVGASTGAAKAADPMNGLVVTMAEYLASCASGSGIQFATWCFKFTGSSTFSSEFGAKITYSPGTANGGGFQPGEAVVTPVGAPVPWTGFNLSNKLALTATRDFGEDKTITVKIPIVGSGTTSLAISRAGGATWTFTSTSITVEVPTNFADFTVAVSESDVAGAFWPDVDVTAEMTFDPVTVTLHGGIGWTDETIWGFAIAPFFEPEADLTVEASLGSVDLTFGAHYQRRFSFVPINAWGVDLEAEATFGMATITVGGAFGAGKDFSGHFNYDPQIGLFPGERIMAVWGELAFEWNDYHTTTLAADYARSFGEPLSPFSGTLDVSLEHAWDVGGDGGFVVTPMVWYQRAFDGFGTQAFGASVELSVPITP